jgi:hypothetical protein
MNAIALELDRKLQTVNASTAERLERLAPDALALTDVAATDEEPRRADRIERGQVYGSVRVVNPFR